mmetsp:Transcript_29632/g.71160  ORF Transcript_29632/g.71160 Transcript_29632/m.71160 type:complete len:321 (-) Transcript_29632:133-1095(-)
MAAPMPVAMPATVATVAAVPPVRVLSVGRVSRNPRVLPGERPGRPDLLRRHVEAGTRRHYVQLCHQLGHLFPQLLALGDHSSHLLGSLFSRIEDSMEDSNEPPNTHEYQQRGDENNLGGLLLPIVCFHPGYHHPFQQQRAPHDNEIQHLQRMRQEMLWGQQQLRSQLHHEDNKTSQTHNSKQLQPSVGLGMVRNVANHPCRWRVSVGIHSTHQHQRRRWGRRVEPTKHGSRDRGKFLQQAHVLAFSMVHAMVGGVRKPLHSLHVQRLAGDAKVMGLHRCFHNKTNHIQKHKAHQQPLKSWMLQCMQDSVRELVRPLTGLQ